MADLERSLKSEFLYTLITCQELEKGYYRLGEKASQKADKVWYNPFQRSHKSKIFISSRPDHQGLTSTAGPHCPD
ncbi:MAG: hypothetical protein AB1478_00025 [Nitrospirota bacterium]